MQAAEQSLGAPFYLMCALVVPGVASDETVTLSGQGAIGD